MHPWNPTFPIDEAARARVIDEARQRAHALRAQAFADAAGAIAAWLRRIVTLRTGAPRRQA